MATRHSTRTLPSDPTKARAHLLASAEQTFEKYGISRTTMDDIAEAAGVSRPTVYRYFGDRDSLVREIITSRADLLVRHFHAATQQFDTFQDQLVEGLLFLARHGRNDQFLHSLMRPGTIELATQLLLDEGGSGQSYMAEFWGPMFRAAAVDNVLRGEVDDDRAYHWLASVTFMLISWLDDGEQPLDDLRGRLRDFVAPAFVA